MGIPETKGLMQTIAPAQQDFRRAVRQTAPMFVPFSRKQAETQSLPHVKFLDNEEEVETVLSTEAHSLEPSESGLRRGVPEGSENGDAIEEGPIYIDDVFALANESVLPLHVASSERYSLHILKVEDARTPWGLSLCCTEAPYFAHDLPVGPTVA